MKFEQNWRNRLKMLTDGRTDGRKHGWTDGRTDDGRKVITIAHPEQSSGELKSRPHSKLHESIHPSFIPSVRPPARQITISLSPFI